MFAMTHMFELGCALSSEEMTPQELVKYAVRAEEAGFTFLAISDHFHPWVNNQGQSPFVWTVLGAIAQATKKLKVITGVTATIIRIHPVILAQATATTASLFGDRFYFGVGTGENLNEHVVGQGWPSYDTRLAMFKESIEIIRTMWEGGLVSYDGDYYSVDTARIYSLPKQPPPIIISAFGPKSAQLAGEIGDGLFTTSPDKTAVETFHNSGGKGEFIFGQTKVVISETEDTAKETAYKYWPHTAVSGQADQELRVPKHFEQIGQSVPPEMVLKNYLWQADPKQHMDQIKQFAHAGYTHLAIGQIGPDQERFFQFYEKQIIPQIRTFAIADAMQRQKGSKQKQPAHSETEATLMGR